jgi:DNA invertase Pin-like site-specific DNA recombinase
MTKKSLTIIKDLGTERKFLSKSAAILYLFESNKKFLSTKLIAEAVGCSPAYVYLILQKNKKYWHQPHKKKKSKYFDFEINIDKLRLIK